MKVKVARRRFCRVPIVAQSDALVAGNHTPPTSETITDPPITEDIFQVKSLTGSKWVRRPQIVAHLLKRSVLLKVFKESTEKQEELHEQQSSMLATWEPLHLIRHVPAEPSDMWV